jgi:hypothetical protein
MNIEDVTRANIEFQYSIGARVQLEEKLHKVLRLSGLTTNQSIEIIKEGGMLTPDSRITYLKTRLYQLFIQSFIIPELKDFNKIQFDTLLDEYKKIIF